MIPLFIYPSSLNCLYLFRLLSVILQLLEETAYKDVESLCIGHTNVLVLLQ